MAVAGVMMMMMMMINPTLTLLELHSLFYAIPELKSV